MESVDGKLIARNTTFVFIRIITSFVVGFISSRLVLQALGADDFGLYSVVGGFIMLFLFMSNSMTQTTTRFLTHEMGKKDGKLNRVFNISNVLHIFTALCLWLILEVVGQWYIIHYINIDKEKIPDALFVFHISVIVAVIGIINVPYRSLFIAHEKFPTVAKIDITNNIIKLLIAISLFYYSGNALRFYAVCMSASTIFYFIVYHLLSAKYWPEIIKWHFVRHISEYRKQFGFNNWNMVGSASEVIQSQGGHILINAFFGPVANAAYAIARSVNTCTIEMARSFNNVASPQIVKLQGGKEKRESFLLTCTTNRISLLIMLLFFFTISVKLDFLLDLWLGDSKPDGALEFCQYILLASIVIASSSGLIPYIDGLGKIKWFNIWKAVFYGLSILLGYIIYKRGLPSQTIILCFILAEILFRLAQLVLLNRMCNFNIVDFVSRAWIRPFFVFAILFVFVCLIFHLDVSNALFNVFCIIIVALTSLFMIYTIGLTPNERKKVFYYLKNKITSEKLRIH